MVNGVLGYFLLVSFLNIDLLKPLQILLLSVLIMNAYLINKKILRTKTCTIDYQPVLIGFGIGLANMVFLIVVKKLFYK